MGLGPLAVRVSISSTAVDATGSLPAITIELRPPTLTDADLEDAISQWSGDATN